MSFAKGDISDQLSGRNGRKRLNAGGTWNAEEGEEAIAVKPITDDFTYGANCEAARGDAPNSGDAVLQGDEDKWPGTKIVSATGDAWIYSNKRLD